MEYNRIRKMVAYLNTLISDNEYYDDDIQKEVCDITEKEAYDILMSNDEFHLLGSETVKKFIHYFMNDYRFRTNMLITFELN